MEAIPGDNQRVADRLRQAASLLHSQGVSPYREKAYRTAANAIAATRFDVRGIFEREGVRGLDAIPGIGLGMASAIGEMLATLPRALDTGSREEPPVADILDVDSEYREKAGAGRLRTIAPKRFNPGGESWLPVMHARRGPWHFTALYSNTALAHKLGRTHDWVVIYFYDGDHVERQCTVVTEPRGPLRGHRIVRGREEQCRAHYAANEAREPA